MPLITRSGCAFAVLLALAGCKALDAPKFQKNARIYSTQAANAEAANDWGGARRNYFLALQNAEWAEEGPAVLADLFYKLGRTDGVTCRFDAAADNFNKAYELNDKNAWPLVELARMNLAQGKADAAAKLFARALPVLEKAVGATRDPMNLAAAFQDYSTALGKLSMLPEADRANARALELRAQNESSAASPVPVPYASQCPR
jgi:tetratricopeptide (TPR) repeat protein